MSVVYLSGPMSGIPDNNFPAFHYWAAELRRQGHTVVSPAEIPELQTWEECLRADLRELCGCNTIALMPGWENSKGANLELHVAHRLGIKVIQLRNEFDLIAHLKTQIEFSLKTFGPGTRTSGVVDHIRKELREIEQDPLDLEEWIDVIILACDGAWRAGFTAEQVAEQLAAKLAKNMRRQWPDWRTADPGKAIEHVRGAA